MQDFGSNSLGEGQFIVRLPYFNRENYSYWKTMMMLFIQANDFHAWKIISNGDVKVFDGKYEWEEGEKKKAQLNANAIHTLFSTLRPNRYNKVSQCQSTKEIWDKLTSFHKGTSQVKESKIGLLTLNYDLFKMESRESFKYMSDRFANIINRLKACGKPVGEIQLRRQFTVITKV